MTEFISLESLTGSPCIVKTDIPNPKVYINGSAANAKQVRETTNGFYEISINKGDHVILSRTSLGNTDLTIKAIPVDKANHNLFGLHDKTLRLPGYHFYFKESKTK